MEIIAHRGIHSGDIRENSREALVSCIGSQADGIEIDIRITADDVCVVHHDTRSLSGSRLSRMIYEELRAQDPLIIPVSEALEVLDPYKGMINLEVKHIFGERDRARGIQCVQQLSRDIQARYDHEHEVISRMVVSSFSLPNMQSLVSHLPEVPRAYLVPRGISFSRMIKRALRHGCSAVHVSVPRMRVGHFEKFVLQAHDLGLQVRVFTVNTEEEFKRASLAGVDAIFTDYVERMDTLRR
ncbi:MAG TPA: glycerophosphodiester phosphodiesterase [Acidimicrobiia bacterium]|nr:glycerophosphodiester phosphodiesterase [Acidimicrobiia bacterium]